MDKVLKELKIYAQKNYVPIIREKSAVLLQNTIANLKPNLVLEIGTAIGYSTSLIFDANKSCKITTVEKNEELYKIACNTFEKRGMPVNAILQDAANVLLQLVQKDEKFDFIFLDGPKGQYIKYLPLCKQLLNDKGVLFADNINHNGMVFSGQQVPHKTRTMIVNLRKFVDSVLSDPSFSTQIFEIEDGVLISVYSKSG